MRRIARYAAIAGLAITFAFTDATKARAQGDDGGFEWLQSIIRPREDQSTWRDVNWLTDVRTARETAAREDKPILVFMAAEGSTIGRT